MAGLFYEIQRETTFRAVSRTVWGAVAAAALYAVVTPDALLGLNPALWGILLFTSIMSFPTGLAADRLCATAWGTVLLALTITYVIFLRDHQTAGGPPIREIEGLQIAFTIVIGFAGILSGVYFLVSWDDKRLEEKPKIETRTDA